MVERGGRAPRRYRRTSWTPAPRRRLQWHPDTAAGTLGRSRADSPQRGENSWRLGWRQSRQAHIPRQPLRARRRRLLPLPPHLLLPLLPPPPPRLLHPKGPRIGCRPSLLHRRRGLLAAANCTCLPGPRAGALCGSRFCRSQKRQCGPRRRRGSLGHASSRLASGPRRCPCSRTCTGRVQTARRCPSSLRRSRHWPRCRCPAPLGGHFGTPPRGGRRCQRP
mmetsp:Transcript_28892/g.84322  ORF Transcript_28892/g.84322 Transcript_28892/m.84322 type:complete len:221 (-) Transcript_28892:1387-2049(-)